MSAPDIFLSYNREDANRAKQFADAFSAEGLDVWWDVALRSGEAYDKVTETALRNAKAVVVLWSPRSVESRWCRAEATLADRNKTLMPAMIEPCERPIMFELVQTAELSDWEGDPSDKAWREFALQVLEFVGKDAKPQASGTRKQKFLPSLDEISVVVLPFANMSRDEDQDYFADGITDDIITDLSKVSALMVIARNTAFKFKGKNVDVVDLARQLNVTHVLEGSIRKAGNKVRVNAQLIDGSTGGHVWAERYDGELDDIFELQDKLTEEIVSALKLTLLPREKKAIEDRGTSNIEAFDYYLQATTTFHTRAAFVEAIKLAKRAVELDPAYSRAWEFLAYAYMDSSFASPEIAGDAVELSRKAFDRAAKLTKDRVRQHTMRAHRLTTIEHDWLGAEQEFVQALELSAKSDADSIMRKAAFLTHTGQLEEAIETARSALRLDPLMAAQFVLVLLDSTRSNEEAQAEYDRQANLQSHPPVVRMLRFFKALSGDDLEEARRRLESYMETDDQLLPFAKDLRAVLADKPGLRSMLSSIVVDPKFRNTSHMANLGLLAAYAEDFELAVDCMHAAFVELGSVALSYLWHPLLAEVRKTDRFKQLIRDLGINKYWRTTGKWGDFARPMGEDDFEIIA
ncbi:TIR domain-containing protein [Altererythrobacter salegens]|uniref:TIR domain-containing protein n=1 Tax=Croceibacterium salegens TaxID=1737568 RepID=A0A6I4SSF9_9SPHN|nr:TIR domain-containing protein [Croceibacterium salegens]MXO58813.1 TIR domain-containing protein [Croceibacterium salegens]